MSTDSFSREAGENRFSQRLSSIVTPFKGAATALILGSTIALSAPPANAQQVPTATLTSLPQDTICNQVDGYPRLNCATPGHETPMTQEDILEDRDLTRNRVILHFGPGVMDAGLVALSLENSDVPTIAIPGGPDGAVHVIIDGYTGPKKKPQRQFTQDDVYGGQLGGFAQRKYKSLMAYKNRQASLPLDAGL